MKTRSSCVLGLALVTYLFMLSAAKAGDVGPIQWAVADGGNGLYYGYFDITDSDHTWTGAAAEAQTLTYNASGTTLYGYLAPVTSQAEANFLDNNLIQPSYGDWTIVWTGDYANNGTLYGGASGAISDTSWITWGYGLSLSDTVGQPDNYGTTIGGAGYDFDWQARTPADDSIGGYIAVFGAEPAPEPSAIIPAALGSGFSLLLLRRKKT